MTSDHGKDHFRLGFLTAIEVPDRGFVGGLLVTNHFGRPLEFQCTAPLRPNRTQEILYGPTLLPYLLGDLIGRTLIEKVGIKPHLVLTEREDLLTLRDLVSIPIACVDDATPEPRSNDASTGEGASAAEIAEASVEGSVVGGKSATSDEPDAAVEVGSLTDGSVSVNTDNSATPVIENATSSSGEMAPIVEPSKRKKKNADSSPGPLRLGRQVLRFHAAHAGDQDVARNGAAVVPNDADLREPFERVREALGETAQSGGVR